MKAAKYLLLAFGILQFSCNSDDGTIPEMPTEKNRAGVVISFDDDYVDEWCEADNILQEYDWKATFFVNYFDRLSPDKIQKLKDLKNKGHEIGAHGLNHLNATTFISQYGADEYLTQEIYPMMQLMNAGGLSPTSFAYPYGARDTSSDNLLLNEFEVIRGTTYGSSHPSLQDCYYRDSPIVFGLGIDNSYPHFSVPYFLSILEYAKKNNKIVVFYGHKPLPYSQNNYETEYNTLIEICKYVKQNDMYFYRISDLNDVQSKSSL